MSKDYKEMFVIRAKDYVKDTLELKFDFEREAFGSITDNQWEALQEAFEEESFDGAWASVWSSVAEMLAGIQEVER